MVERNSIFGTAIDELGLEEEERPIERQFPAIPPGVAPPISGAPEGFQPQPSPTSKSFVVPEDRIPEKINPAALLTKRINDNIIEGFKQGMNPDEVSRLLKTKGMNAPIAIIESMLRTFLVGPAFGVAGAGGQIAEETGIVENEAEKRRFQRDLLMGIEVSGARIPKIRAPSLVPKAPIRQRIDVTKQKLLENRETVQARSASVMQLQKNAIANEKRVATRAVNLEKIQEADISAQHKAVLAKQQLEGTEGPQRRLERLTGQVMDSAQAEKIRRAEVEKAPPGMRTATDPKLMKSVTDEINSMIDQRQIIFDPLRPITEQMVEAISQGKVPQRTVQRILRENNLTSKQFTHQMLGDTIGTSVSEAAREMARMSGVQDRMMKMMKKQGLSDGAMIDLLEVAGGATSASSRIANAWNRVTNLWRGALVSQQSTSSRNFISQGGRVGMDALHRGVEHVLLGGTNLGRKALGKPPKVPPNPIDALATIQSVFSPKQSKIFTDFALKNSPHAKQRLFQRYMGDVKTAQTSLNNPGAPIHEFLSNPSRTIKLTMAKQQPDLLGKLEGIIDLMNTVNRGQEWMYRRAITDAELKRRLKGAGLDWEDIQRRNAANEIPQEHIIAAVKHANDLTYAGDLPGNVYGKAMGAIGRLPVPFGFAPFTRFMHNLMKTTAEYSPLGFAHAITSRSGRAKIKQGDLSALAKGMVGTLLLGTGTAYRLSGAGGEKYYEIGLPDGTTIDARPFAPLPQYLFMGELAKRLIRGEDLPTRDEFAEALTGQRMVRPEFIKLVDEVQKAINDPDGDAWDKAGRITKTWLAEHLTGYLTWFKQFQTMYSQWSPEERLHRSRAGNEVKSAFSRVVPTLGQDLPERQSITREATPRNVKPLLKAITGVRVQEKKNIGEKEIDRLGLSFREVRGNSLGSPEANDRFNEVTGPIVEKMLGDLIPTEKYQKAGDRDKAQQLKQALQSARRLGRNIMRQSDNQQDRDFVKRKRPRRERLAKRERIRMGLQLPDADAEALRQSKLSLTEKSMEGLDIERRRLFGDPSGLPEADAAFDKIVGSRLNKSLDRFIQSRSFAQVPDDKKRGVLLKTIKREKSKARKQFRVQFPELQRLKRLYRKFPNRRAAIRKEAQKLEATRAKGR